jgi:hypothetical protein
MVATFIVELLLALYTFIRYKTTALTRLITLTLVLLATFQLAEYNVCGASPFAPTWSRIGYVAITLLPPLGIHLIVLIAKKGWQWLVWPSYLVSGLFALVFGFSKSAFENHACTGNYVIFHLADSLGRAYYAYYYGLLILGIILGLYLGLRTKSRVRQALLLQVLGYLVFVVPTIVLNTINPATKAGIPSIMCGFAVIYALILSFGIAPLAIPKRVKKRR